VIRRLDQKKAQVFLEIEVLTLAQSLSMAVTTSLLGGMAGGGTKAILGFEGGSLIPIAINTGTVVDPATQAASFAAPFSSDLNVGVLSSKGVTIDGLGTLSPSALAKFMKSDSENRVLSTPFILTSDNEEASFAVGSTVFIKNSKVDNVTGVVDSSVDKENVDLTLTVKPNISKSGYLSLTVQLDANEIANFTADGNPNISKRKIKQVVTLKNAQTALVSGINTISRKVIEKKIPFWGDIPILGWFGRTYQRQDDKGQIMIFMTPHIIYGDNDLKAIFDKTVKENSEVAQMINEKVLVKRAQKN
jgi:general secretion pathway protein D